MSIKQNQKILAKDIREKLRVNYIEPQCLTTTKNGITLTNNGDGTYTLNGTTTTDSYFRICRVKVKGKFKLTGTPRNRGNSSLYEAVDYRVDLGDGVIIEEDGSRYIDIVIAVYSGSYNNVLYKPMLTNDLDSTYDDFVSTLFDVLPVFGGIDTERRLASITTNSYTATEDCYVYSTAGHTSEPIIYMIDNAYIGRFVHDASILLPLKQGQTLNILNGSWYAINVYGILR